MTDRELLELAAKAAGVDIDGMPVESYWNPLKDDGDALRLAVKLGLKNYFQFDLQPLGAMITCIGNERFDIHEGAKHQDLYAATRRAIVRAAAEIGRDMK